MRFPAIQPKQPLRDVTAAESIQQAPAKQPAVQQSVTDQEPSPPRPDELPAALDERLRLVGEW